MPKRKWGRWGEIKLRQQRDKTRRVSEPVSGAGTSYCLEQAATGEGGIGTLQRCQLIYTSEWSSWLLCGRQRKTEWEWSWGITEPLQEMHWSLWVINEWPHWTSLQANRLQSTGIEQMWGLMKKMESKIMAPFLAWATRGWWDGLEMEQE